MALDTSVKHYTWTMNAVPTLNGTANSVIRLLDAILVNGFGDVTLTSLSVTDNIATATVSTGYNVAPYCVVTIAGATPSGLNGDKKVLSSGNVVNGNTTTFTFEANGISNGAATGTITCRFPGAGWTKPYANTTANVAVYRNSTANNGTGFYFRITDSSTSLARIIGYETMSDVNTGTGIFPTDSQLSGGLYIPKTQGGATPKKWWIAANHKTCYYASAVNDTWVNNIVPHVCFGDFKPNNYNADNYNCILATSTGDTGLSEPYKSFLSATTSTAYRRLFFARAFNQAIGAKEGYNLFLYYNILSNGVTGASTGGLTYPNMPDNNLFACESIVYESSSIRGVFHGLYMTPFNLGGASRLFANDTVFENFPVSGKISLLKHIGSTDYDFTGAFFIDIVGPWD